MPWRRTLPAWIAGLREFESLSDAWSDYQEIVRQDQQVSDGYPEPVGVH